MTLLRRIALSAVVATLASACERYDRVERPLPNDFEAVLLSGGRWDVAAARGHPWVVNLWVPG